MTCHVPTPVTHRITTLRGAWSAGVDLSRESGARHRRRSSCAAVLLRLGLFISLPSQCPLQTARLVGEEPARHDTVWQLTVVETPVICMKPLPLNRTPSPGRVVPSSARPSYSVPLANSVGVARLMDSSPTCAQNGFTFYRCAACQPQSRVEPAARAAPRPGKARRKVTTSISCLLGVLPSLAYVLTYWFLVLRSIEACEE